MLQRMDIVKHRKLLLLISALVIAAGLVGFFTMGLNLDIDFIGGTTLHYDLGRGIEDADVERMAQLVEQETGIAPSSLQRAGEGQTEIIIKTREIDTLAREAVFAAMQAEYGLSEDAILTVDNVSATVGADLRSNAFRAVLIAIGLMLLYITIRFRFLTGAATVLCLLHDVLIMLSAYVLLQIPFNSSFIAAVLTILGYSINATIIIFDRVRENRRLMKNETPTDIVNRSVGQTFARSVNTSLTTLIVIALLYAFGVESIRIFALPILVGLLAGTYSSVFLAGNFWLLLGAAKQTEGDS